MSCPQDAARIVIGIAGASCSGKSTLAASLERALPAGSVTVVPIDSYHHGHRPGERPGGCAPNFDEPAAIADTLLVEHVRDLAAGRDVRSPVYDFATHSRAPGWRPLAPRPIIIVEGLFALHWPSLLDALTLKVFVSASRSACLERRLQRDVAERGRTPESVLAQFQGSVWPMYVRHVEPTRTHADLLVDGMEPADSGVAMVLAKIGRVRVRSVS